MAAYVCPRWRNFVAKTYPISVTTKMNEPVEINLRPYLLQGANPIDYDVINDKNFQGAFWLNFSPVTYPQYGRLLPSLKGTGWRYYPKKDYVGTDSFDYILNNGTQDSDPATVTIEITPGLSGNIIVYKAQDVPYWFLAGSHVVPASFGSYDMVTYTWIKKIPYVEKIFRVPYVHHRYEVMYTSYLEYGLHGEPKTKFLAARTDWERSEWPDKNLVGYLPNTSIPYIQPEGPFPYILKIDFFRKAVYSDIMDNAIPPNKIGIVFDYWLEHESIEIEVTQACGVDWFKDGNVVYIEKDDPNYPDI